MNEYIIIQKYLNEQTIMNDTKFEKIAKCKDGNLNHELLSKMLAQNTDYDTKH